MKINAALVTLSLALIASASAQVTTDIWDLSQGSTITLDSGTLFGPNGMFGGSTGGPEPSGLLFRDDKPASFTHFIQWTTPSLISLTGYELFASSDDRSNPGDRGFTQFRLYSRPDSSSSFALISTYSPSSPVYNFDLPVTFGAPIVAKEFRAEFDQYAPNDFPGPRVNELDGFGTTVPEPSSVALFSSVVLFLSGVLFGCLRRRFRTPERNG